MNLERMEASTTQENFRSGYELHIETIKPVAKGFLGVGVIFGIVWLKFGYLWLWALLMALLLFGAHFIVHKSAETNELVCPKCRLNLAYDAYKVFRKGKCPRCRVVIFDMEK